MLLWLASTAAPTHTLLAVVILEEAWGIRMVQAVISGKHAAIEKCRELLSADKDFKVVDQDEVDDDFRTAPMGMEPLTYLVVIFVGHLAAGLSHDYIKNLIEEKMRSSGVQGDLDVDIKGRNESATKGGEDQSNPPEK